MTYMYINSTVNVFCKQRLQKISTHKKNIKKAAISNVKLVHINYNIILIYREKKTLSGGSQKNSEQSLVHKKILTFPQIKQ